VLFIKILVSKTENMIVKYFKHVSNYLKLSCQVENDLVDPILYLLTPFLASEKHIDNSYL